MINKEEMKKRVKKSNKGFSLVELIVVIAIMAILVGVVGMQVLPYIEKSKEAKDEQIISAICTSAVTAFSNNAGDLDPNTSYTLTIDTATTCTAVAGGSGVVANAANVITDFKTLTKYNTMATVTAALGSKKGKNTTKINIVYDYSDGKVTVTPLGAAGASVLDSVSSN